MWKNYYLKHKWTSFNFVVKRVNRMLKYQQWWSAIWIVQALSCKQRNKAWGNTCAQVVSAREGIALHKESLMNSDRFHLQGRHPVPGLTAAFQFFFNYGWSDFVCRSAVCWCSVFSNCKSHTDLHDYSIYLIGSLPPTSIMNVIAGTTALLQYIYNHVWFRSYILPTGIHLRITDCKYSVNNGMLPIKRGPFFNHQGYCVNTVHWFPLLSVSGYTLRSFLYSILCKFDKWISNIVDSAVSIENYPAVLCVCKHAQLGKHYISSPLATRQVRTVGWLIEILNQGVSQIGFIQTPNIQPHFCMWKGEGEMVWNRPYRPGSSLVWGHSPSSKPSWFYGVMSVGLNISVPASICTSLLFLLLFYHWSLVCCCTALQRA